MGARGRNFYHNVATRYEYVLTANYTLVSSSTGAPGATANTSAGLSASS